ncbi:MAG: thiamine-phosphate kinase [Arenicellales bacterium]|jgi:thiamine-monophosphate kinase|nr:thiamine-phosphate kinase [Arenicellales bacterium]MDP6790931.1 thiamine-phosphate kinase [Arenicellales bacterium]
MDEFELIDQIFHRREDQKSWVSVGVGDDGAVLDVTPGKQSVVVMDTLVSGVHFLHAQPADSIGHRALAVNLSDIAAMGATPRWATLSLTIPDFDGEWLRAFAEGFFKLAQIHGVALVGGDTTAGPLAISVTVGGEVDPAAVLRRSGAKSGDRIFVSGRLGGAAAALSCEEASTDRALQQALWYPEPRVDLGMELGRLAHSAIDLSDGLLADLGHVLKASGGLGADIEADQVPLFDASVSLLEYRRALELALGGGDDYELCFTAPDKAHQELLSIGSRLGLEMFCIGRITREGGCCVRGGPPGLADITSGYRHLWRK